LVIRVGFIRRWTREKGDETGEGVLGKERGVPGRIAFGSPLTDRYNYRRK